MSSPIIITTPPKIFVIGWTQFYRPGIGQYLRYRDVEWDDSYTGDATHDEFLIEAAGRVCYGSWDNPGKKTTEAYISQQIVEADHLSVVEHCTINFMVADLPRSVLMELSRHRVGDAKSFESTRFTDKNMRVIMPPMIRKMSHDDQIRWQARAEVNVGSYYRQLEDFGYSPGLKRKQRKRIIEAARGHLPNEQGCDGVWTVNLRQLRHVMLLRSHPDADLSFREFACELFDPAEDLFPSVFKDLTKVVDDEDYYQIVRRE